MCFNEFNKKRILITGASGFVGTNLIKKLLDYECNIRGIIYKNQPRILDNKIQYIRNDLTSYDNCRKVCSNMDYVFMCAANTSGAAIMEKDPLSHVTDNLVMNSYMLKAAYENRVKKFIFISSSTVYPVVNFPVKENDFNGELFEKYFCVGWMKRFSEIIAEMYSTKTKEDFNSIIIRPGNIYGPYDKFDFERSHVVPALIKKTIEKHDPIDIWGEGKDIKDFIYIDDFIEGMLSSAIKLTGFDIMNISSGIQYTIMDILYSLFEIVNYRLEVRFNPDKPTMIPKRAIDVSKAKDKLGFVTKTSLFDGLRKTVDWYKNEFNKNH